MYFREGYCNSTVDVLVADREQLIRSFHSYILKYQLFRGVPPLRARTDFYFPW